MPRNSQIETALEARAFGCAGLQEHNSINPVKGADDGG